MTIAYAGLIFSGGAATSLLFGMSSMLLGFAMLSIIVALGSRNAGTACVCFGSTAIVQATAVYAADAYFAHKGIPEGLLRSGAVVITCGAITVAAGIALATCGAMRIGSLVRLLPHPVASGFFCGLGVAFAMIALTLAASAAPGVGLLVALQVPDVATRVGVCAAVAVVLLVAPRRFPHWATMPSVLLLTALAYHAVRLVLGQSIPAAQAAGWLFGPFQAGSGIMLPPIESFALLDWNLGLILLPLAASIALLSAITLALMVAGIEAIQARQMDVDREMAIGGLANIGAGIFGGVSGGHGVTSTAVLAGFDANSRLAASMPAFVALGVCLAGADILALLPRPVVAGLLLTFGIEWMGMRAWREARRLPRHEAAILFLVAASMAAIGVVAGLAIGLGLALLIFVWTYRRVPIIRSVLRGNEIRSSVTRSGVALHVLGRESHRILLFRLQGYLFFLNAQAVCEAFTTQRADDTRVVILDFGHVLGMDSSAIDAFRRLEQQAAEYGIDVILSAMRPELAERFAWQGVFQGRAFTTVANADRALEHSEERLLHEAGVATEGEIGRAHV